MRLLLILLMLLPAPAHAGIEVVASIAPVHSLVARVMQGTGAPRLLMPPGTEPHDYALRPSDAAALSGAALVVRVGPELEGWMDRPLQTLASGATVLDLAALPGVTRLKAREGAAFEPDPHGDPAKGGTAGGRQPTGPDGHWLEPLATIAHLSAVTTRLRFSTNILIAALRRPAVLAKTLPTIDVLSRGRLDLGVAACSRVAIT